MTTPTQEALAELEKWHTHAAVTTHTMNVHRRDMHLEFAAAARMARAALSQPAVGAQPLPAQQRCNECGDPVPKAGRCYCVPAGACFHDNTPPAPSEPAQPVPALPVNEALDAALIDLGFANKSKRLAVRDFLLNDGTLPAGGTLVAPWPDTERQVVRVPEGLFRAIERAGFTVLKTQYGWELRKLGPIVAQSTTHPQPAQAVEPAGAQAGGAIRGRFRLVPIETRPSCCSPNTGDCCGVKGSGCFFNEEVARAEKEFDTALTTRAAIPEAKEKP